MPTHYTVGYGPRYTVTKIPSLLRERARARVDRRFSAASCPAQQHAEVAQNAVVRTQQEAGHDFTAGLLLVALQLLLLVLAAGLPLQSH